MKAKNYAARKKAANWIVILIIFVVAVLMLIPFLLDDLHLSAARKRIYEAAAELSADSV